MRNEYGALYLVVEGSSMGGVVVNKFNSGDSDALLQHPCMKEVRNEKLNKRLNQTDPQDSIVEIPKFNQLLNLPLRFNGGTIFYPLRYY